MSRRPLRATSHSSSHPVSSLREKTGLFSSMRGGSRDEVEWPIRQMSSRRPSGGVSSPDPSLPLSTDRECLQLVENTRRIRKASWDSKKMDGAWEVYKGLREECYHLCKSLLSRIQDGQDTSAQGDVNPCGSVIPYSGTSTTASTARRPVDDAWLSVIHDYKVAQHRVHNTLQDHMLAVLKEYQPDSTEKQAKQFLASKELRKGVIAHWREISLRKMISEKLLFWEQFRIRSLNFHALTLDILAVEKLFLAVQPGTSGITDIHETVASESDQPMLHALATRGDEAWPLRLSIACGSGRDVSHTQDEDENMAAKRDSRASTGNSFLMIAQSFPTPPTFQISQELWEASIDYAYNHGAEANCDYHWEKGPVDGEDNSVYYGCNGTTAKNRRSY